jgi:hypothetical protein
MRKIILFELNEVPFKVIDTFCSWRPNSALARLLPRMQQYETTAEDSKLSPWTTWPTVHRGVSDRTHMIHEFGQELEEVNTEFPAIWEILEGQGVSTGVCGSLHTYPVPAHHGKYSFFVPDTFAAGIECIPEELSTFQDFNLAMVRESGRNVSRKIDIRRALSVLINSRKLGLRPETYLDVGMQLLGETVQSWRHIRRRTYQAVLIFDLFMKQLQEKSPAFSTFFTNHVASSMHRYWAATFPNDYVSSEFSEEWSNTYRNEIDWTMSKFDQFLQRLVLFVDQHPEYVLWIATSMGQAATVAKEVETQLMLTDLPRFMRKMGLLDTEWERRPAMIPQVNVVAKPHAQQRLRAALSELLIDGKPLLVEEHEGGFFAMSFGYTNLHERSPEAIFRNQKIPFTELGLAITRIDDKCGATAYHIPSGSLLVYDPQFRGGSRGRLEISTRSIAPAILRNFELPVPSYMDASSSPLLLIN